MNGCAWMLLLPALALAGCASQEAEQALARASASYEGVRQDPDVLRSAPKEVTRAGESLERAQRFSGYLGASGDVAHYAYLSQRYSEIARQHSELALNQERAAQMGMERDRLRMALQEAELLSAQQQGRWLEDQMMSLAATETDRGLVMTLGDVLFQSGSSALSPSASRTLLRLAHFLRINPQRVIRIEGYSDNRGNAAANLELSRARAQSVAQLLQELGVAPERMQVTGYGEAYPLAENASERGRAQNRRVEIVFSDAQGVLSAPR
ncbi:OmpA family protein [Stutzerimonas azotifigens]|uniref:OmpA family protein n=1 Tax=Stutzerimonas azotifigens TaxID=291995 RepID=UPI0004837678|nr:OmpA family protein [Stutzerimonas azotifigens]